MRQYNKDLYKDKPALDAAGARLGTWSYVNTYDALYDKYSQNKNFNINMWRDAIALGEQDNYFALLSQNADRTMSPEFYDDEYYDYEAMMMEMYLPFADNTKTEKYTRDVFNTNTGKWEVQDLGEMTQRQYFENLLADTKAIRAEEIQRAIDLEHKESLSFMRKFGADIASVFGELGEGALSALTGLVDVFGGLGYATGAAFEGENWADAFVEYFGELGLTAAEKRTVRAALDEYERTKTHFRDIDGNFTNVGKYFAGVSNSIGMMIPSMVLAPFTGGTSFTWLPSTSFYAAMFSTSMHETANNTDITGPSWLKIANTAVKAGAEYLIEWGLGKVLGSTIQNKMLGIGGRNLSDDFIKGFNKWSGTKYVLKSAGQEGLEEFLQDFGTSCIDAFTGLFEEGYGREGINFQTLADSFFLGVLSSLVLSTSHVGAGALLSRARNAAKAGSGDVTIEVNGEIKKLKGFNKLYYGQILSDFKEAVNELKESKFGTKKNVALAKEVYGAMSAISQFYSSFDQQRIKNCERLLDRVVKIENEKTQTVDAEKSNREFVTEVEKTFTEMISHRQLHHEVKSKVEQLKKTVENNKKTLEKGDVKHVKNISIDNSIADQVKEQLSQKTKSRYDELHEKYKYIFTTDGHVAIDDGDVLFVPEGWIENYTSGEIYEFLAQSNAIENILGYESMKSLLDDIEQFHNEFVKDKSVDREEILYNFLFNSKFYQSFILTDGGKYIHKHKEQIFSLYQLIGGSAREWFKKFNIKEKGVYEGKLNNVLDRVRKTWREPTLKAVLNWGFDLQETGADAILNQTDRKYIALRENRKRVLRESGNTGRHSSAHEHLVNDILREGSLNSDEKAFIRYALYDKNATEEEKLLAQILLDIADWDVSDYYHSAEYTWFRSQFDQLQDQIGFIYHDNEITQAHKEVLNGLARLLFYFNSERLSSSLVLRKQEVAERAFALTAKSEMTIEDWRAILFDVSAIKGDIIHALTERKGITDYSITLPYQVASLLDERDTVGAQLVADVLEEFEKKYGISARQMMVGDLTGMSVQQRNQLTQDMEIVFGTNDFVRFVQRYIENRLGDNYIVTPITVSHKENELVVSDFVVAKKISAKVLLSQEIFDMSIEDRANAFYAMTASNHINFSTNDIIIKVYNNVIRALENSNRKATRYLKMWERTLGVLVNHIYAGEQLTRDVLESLMDETLTENGETELGPDLFVEIFEPILLPKICKIEDIIDISSFDEETQRRIREIELVIEPWNLNYGGYYDSDAKKIVICEDQDSPFSTFVHEFNHLLQDIYNMPNGFSPEVASSMPDFLAYVCENYTMAVNFHLRRSGHNGITADITKNYINTMPKSKRNCIAMVAYLLVQGEVWARTFLHNGKPVHGFLEVFDGKNKYILAPDNKTKFQINFVESTPSSKSYSSKASEKLIGSALDVAIQKLFVLKWQQDRDGSFSTSRDTYHSYLTKNSSTALTTKLLNPFLSLMDRLSVRKLSDVIRNPQKYLAPEILAACKGDFSEGNVFWRVKEFVEKNFEDGVSIDVNEKQEYIWVDDNAFDDLLITSIREKRKSDKISIVDKYQTLEPIKLTEFYAEEQLNALGIDPRAYILIDPNNGSETILDKYYPHGIIILDVNENTTDAEFIDELNHEFRHLLQYYNGFAAGSSPDFEVTDEMRADVKAHLPELFKNEEVVKWAKRIAERKKIKNYEDIIVQRYIYYATSGELMAHAFSAEQLYAKPVFVNDEAGNLTIFMSWYNPKTGEGRYKTDNIGYKHEKSTHLPLPRVKKAQRKYKERKVFVGENGDVERILYNYENKRRFNKKTAEGTNLMYFWKKGESYRQMDPELQVFIIATTDRLDELPKELAQSIKDGILTKQALFNWFRTTDDINQFTFDLMKKYFFPNTALTTPKELDKFLELGLPMWWAAGDILRRHVDMESLLTETSVYTLEGLFGMLKNTDLYQKILDRSKAYYKKEGRDVAPTDKLLRYQRLFAMQYFDGTLASAFYVSHAFKKTLLDYEAEMVNVSIDEGLRPDDTKDNKKTTVGERISNTAKTVGSAGQNNYGNDIRAIYNITDIKSYDEMIQELALAYTKKTAEAAGFDTSDMDALRENVEFLPVLQDTLSYFRKLKKLNVTNPDAIEQMWADLTNTSLVGNEPTDDTLDISSHQTSSSQNRISIRDKIRRRADKILKYIREGKITFEQLPPEIQEMFVLEDVMTRSGKKTKAYVLKTDVYSVGRGRASISDYKDEGRFKYAQKHDISKGHEAFRHDTTQILENLNLLDRTIDSIKKLLSVSETDRINGKTDVAKVNKRIDKTAKVLEDALTGKSKKVVEMEESSGKSKKKKDTEFRTKKRYTQTDTPNIFTISSTTDMPDVLHKILDTSFDEFADTEVQFVSIDEQGNLYTKDKHGKFDSRVKHEKTNWDAFYEANRDTLQTLTRDDVLKIITYFTNATVNGGPTGKFKAFEIFLLGFFVDAARHNYNSWNFSDQEIANLEKLFEARASEAGSALNAVSQMIKVVNPIKVIKSRMLDDWDAINDDDKEELIRLIDELHSDGTDVNRQKDRGKAIGKLMSEFAERQRKANELHASRWSKAWWAKVWSNVKSFRFMGMLSGPATWIRNKLGNVILNVVNKSADAIGNFIFRVSKKTYRENQWDLHNTSTSDAAKQFIDLYIKENPVFDPMYNLSGKYDPRRKKEIEGERGLFVSVITKAYEKEYAAKANNFLTKIIQWGIGDGFFIKGSTLRYFGKMLTIEAKRGKIDLSQGLTGDALNLFAEAVIMANGEYMHKRSAMSDMLDGIRDKHPILYECLNFWQPFLNSSVNWYVEKFIRLTPIGLVDACVRMTRFEKQVQKLDERRARGESVVDSRATEFLVRRDIGKGVVGMLFSTLGIILAFTGRLRIDEEDEKFYIYAGDVKLDISDIFASSSVFIGASIAQRWIEQKDGDVASAEDMFELLTNTVLDGFIAVDILERHKWDSSPYEYFLTETNSILSSFVPQMWQTVIACTNNQKIRYSSGMKGMWERWLNTFVPVQPFGSRRINPYTGETESYYALPIVGGLLKKGVLGPKIWWTDISEAERLCRELGVDKAELSGEITVDSKKKKLDRITLNEKYGELNKEGLTKIKSQKHKVEMPNGKYQTLSWDKMSDEQRARVISRTMTQNAEIAKIYVWTQLMGKKYYASGQVWENLRTLGITKNVYKGDKDFVE